MNVFVTGGEGQLGSEVVASLRGYGRGISCRTIVTAPGMETFDITDEKVVRATIDRCSPDVIVHCAAYTAVDKAEDEPEMCERVNVTGTRYIARAARDSGAAMLYISTDYVFDGSLGRPYEIDDITAPLSVYGRSKLAGEDAVIEILDRYYIIRSSWMFGARGDNFVKTILNIGKEKGTVDVVKDQIGSPTYTSDLAKFIVDMIQTEKYGIYHATNEEYCSWYEFACEIFRKAGLDVHVAPIESDAYPYKALRPKNSRLSKKSIVDAGFVKLPTWKDALAGYFEKVNL
ncbi:MAG: dTDP-4-dehydrorhamnose reductase [Clostridiales Family XIII bacterium]|jgi:dTDP-4-dehydrorhamnose reductase|nr:dTDP-4-dehydrorhamnose reductase [Clostridiales Family XIII bacterium]